MADVNVLNLSMNKEYIVNATVRAEIELELSAFVNVLDVPGYHFVDPAGVSHRCTAVAPRSADPTFTTNKLQLKFGTVPMFPDAWPPGVEVVVPFEDPALRVPASAPGDGYVAQGVYPVV